MNCVCCTVDFGTLGCGNLCDNKYSPNPKYYFVSFNLLADEEEEPEEGEVDKRYMIHKLLEEKYVSIVEYYDPVRRGAKESATP